MKGIRIDSMKLSDIDMNKCYFNPGCALSIYKPESEHKVLAMLNKHFGPVKMHNICCHHDPELPPGSTIINNCAGCDRRFRSLYEGIQTITLWEVIDSIEEVNKLQKERAAQMPCQDVAVYCVSCIKSMAIGGKTANHMVDLILGEETEDQETRLDLYHDALDEYIDAH